MTMGRWVILFLLGLQMGCQHRPWAAFERCAPSLPGESRQAVVVGRDDAFPSGMAIRLYERDESGGWRPIGTPIPATVGIHGLALKGEKREGDGMTPSGVFPLERCFGYEPLVTRLPYIVLTPEMVWVDDPRSDRYNTLTVRKEAEGFSAETMRRADVFYKYGIVVEYNTMPVVPGAGSAIFFHLWRGPVIPTAGCVAMAESDMVRLLTWLEPDRHPLAVIGEACP